MLDEEGEEEEEEEEESEPEAPSEVDLKEGPPEPQYDEETQKLVNGKLYL